MCRRADCPKCGKVTWAGCGAHVDAVMRGVPETDRCRCHEQATTEAPRKKAWWSFGER